MPIRRTGPRRTSAPFLGAVPQDRLLMLDYFCEFTEIWKQTEKFHGQPYLWCYLGNFGGNTMLSGNFHTVSARMEDAFAHGGDNLRGVGSTLEGFGVNQFMYEFVLDKAWNTGIADDEWIARLADRRTRFRDPAPAPAADALRQRLHAARADRTVSADQCASRAGG